MHTVSDTPRKLRDRRKREIGNEAIEENVFSVEANEHFCAAVSGNAVRMPQA